MGVSKGLGRGCLMAFVKGCYQVINSATSILSPFLLSWAVNCYFSPREDGGNGAGTWLDHEQRHGLCPFWDRSCPLPSIEPCLAVQVWGCSGVSHVVSRFHGWSRGFRAPSGDPFLCSGGKWIGVRSRKGQAGNWTLISKGSTSSGMA